MDRFSKLLIIFEFKLNFNRGQFYTEISEFGYFKKLKKSWLTFSFKISNQNLIKNYLILVEHL